ncbi:stomatin-like protein [Plasmodium relictum]|uniref:Stomatin-like protein n=1 Tax=Plasmodium relictum TaxID=85471 RepID=A0A1J1H4D8_PLARL|nr:stomatin-like protein [Plasmodium relictum]CRG99774.1 stomatin-like protein [Plasmodium relictum]
MIILNKKINWSKAFLQNYKNIKYNKNILNQNRNYYTNNYILENFRSLNYNKNIFNQRRNFYTSNGNKKFSKKFWNNLGFVIIPQETAYIVERLGKYKKTLLAGFHFLIPFIDKVAYVFSLKEETITIPNQTAITKDNVTLNIDGVLYIKCENPYNSSYGIEDAIFAVTQLAQVTMRSELGKLTLDATFLERDNLNEKIVKAINESAKNWGIKCMRYEIRDIILPLNIKNAMEKQAEAERRKRAEILQSEGERESEINIAIGKKRKSILIAEGQSFAIKAKADATAEAIEIISNKIKKLDSNNAISLLIAEQYIDVFSNICKNNNTIIIPADLNNISSLISQSLSIYNNIQNSKKTNNKIESHSNNNLIPSDVKN